ncbi:hypothetical protein ACQEU8_21855 [Streptomyces sp. CA-250714]|uniref:hypothetical protein n=1 Tax=Streptomyces sp. CA-250714 TaxID=3240060 RepID=UPI003D92F16B
MSVVSVRIPARKLGSALATVGALAAVLPTCAAQAAPPDQGQAAAPASDQGRATAAANVSCQAGGRAFFSPGLLPVPVPRDTNVQYNGQDRSCSGSTPDGGQIATAKFNGAFDAPMSCVVGGGDVPTEGTGTIAWKTKDGKSTKSTLSLTISGQLFNSATVDGHVTDGAFAGARLHGKFRVDLVREGINCGSQSLAGGLKQAPFDGSFNIKG